MTTDRRYMSPRVTYDEARAVLEKLVAEGKARPSAIDLHNELKRGGFSTLQKHVDRFREETPRAATVLVMSKEAQEFYLRDMQRQVDEARRELEVELAELKQEKAKALEESERLETELQGLSTSHEEVSSLLQQKLGVIDQLQVEITRLREQEDAIRESARQQIAAAQAALDQRLAEARQKAESDIKQADLVSEQFRREAETAKNDLARAQARLEVLGTLEEENKLLRSTVKTLEDKVQKAEREAAVSAERSNSLGERLTEVQTTYGDRLLRLEAENLGLLKSLQDSKATLQKAEQAAALAEEKVKHVEQRLVDYQDQSRSRQSLLESSIQSSKTQIESLLKNAESDKKSLDALLKKETALQRQLKEAEEIIATLESK
jgi:chromosome segregation ATPase